MGAISIVIEPRTRDLGGFTVGRVLPFAKRRTVGPFIFFDEMGPAAFPPGAGIDVRPHPHIGLATVTYLFEGEIRHRDSLGMDQVIRPGDVNWMTAGRGIAHSERTDDEPRKNGQKMHGIQSWVALPEASEETDPAFHHHPKSSLPVIERPGLLMRLIAGSAFGETSPAKTFSPMFYLGAEAEAGADIPLPDDHEERALYILDGAVDRVQVVAELVEQVRGHLALGGHLDLGGDALVALLLQRAEPPQPEAVDAADVVVTVDDLGGATPMYGSLTQSSWHWRTE